MLTLVTLCSLAAPAGLAQATPVAVANQSFEAPAIPAGTFATTAPPPGWTGFGTLNFGARTIGVLHPATTTLYAVPPPHGVNVGVVFLMDDPGNQLLFTRREAGLQQTLADVLRTDRRYTLTVDVGNIANDVAAPFLFGGFPGYRVELQAGGVVIAADANTLLPAEGRFLRSRIEVEIGASHPQAGQPLRIRLVNLNAAPGIEVNFDDVRLEWEPNGVWSDLGFALAGTLGAPRLQGSGPLAQNGTNRFALSRAVPSAPAILVLGVSAISLPIFGGTLVPSPDVILPLPIDGAGGATFAFLQAAPMAPGTRIHAQAWILDAGALQGWAASNAVVGVSP